MNIPCSFLPDLLRGSLLPLHQTNGAATEVACSKTTVPRSSRQSAQESAQEATQQGMWHSPGRQAQNAVRLESGAPESSSDTGSRTDCWKAERKDMLLVQKSLHHSLVGKQLIL